jgi:hypothetical protein
LTDLHALAELADRLASKDRLALVEAISDPMERAKALGALADDLVVSLAPLRIGGQSGYWTPAPRSKGVRVYRATVYRLVAEGRLVWGNRCGSFAVRADEA